MASRSGSLRGANDAPPATTQAPGVAPFLASASARLRTEAVHPSLTA